MVAYPLRAFPSLVAAHHGKLMPLCLYLVAVYPLLVWRGRSLCFRSTYFSFMPQLRSSHLTPPHHHLRLPLKPQNTVTIHRQPQALPFGSHRQGRPCSSEVGPGVPGHPLLVRCLHEPSSRQDGGIRRRGVRRLPRRGPHPLQQRPLHQGCPVRRR